MGLFKTKEEKIAERRKWRKRIAESPMTQTIQNILLDKYGSLDSEEIQKLRRTDIRNCRLQVENEGFIFTLINQNGETVDGWGVSFDAMGYMDLPDIGVQILKKIMLKILRDISHLSVSDSGYIEYNADRPKNEW